MKNSGAHKFSTFQNLRLGAIAPQWCAYLFWATTDWKLVQKRTRNALFSRPKSSFGGVFTLHSITMWKLYPSQTKILEGWTKEEIRIMKEALFKGVSTRFGIRTIENAVENPWWETTFPRNTHAGFCKDFTTVSMGCRIRKCCFSPWSKILIYSFVHPSKIFVLEG